MVLFKAKKLNLLIMDYNFHFLEDNKFQYLRGTRILSILGFDKTKSEPDAVGGFFSTLSLEYYPQFFNDILNRGGYYRYEMSFFYGPLEDEGEITKENEVCIRTYMDIAKISVEDFEELALILAHKAIEAVAWFNLKELGYVDQQWIDDIKNWIKAKEK